MVVDDVHAVVTNASIFFRKLQIELLDPVTTCTYLYCWPPSFIAIGSIHMENFWQHGALDDSRSISMRNFTFLHVKQSQNLSSAAG